MSQPYDAWEQRVQNLEDEGLTRSDAQAVVDAEDIREGRDAARERAEFALKTRTPAVQDEFDALLERHWKELQKCADLAK